MQPGEAFRAAVESLLAESPDRHTQYHRDYALHRYDEGRKAAAYLAGRYPEALAKGARILDIGGGIGGFILAFAERREFDCYWLDRYPAGVLADVLAKTDLRVHRTITDVSTLPVRSGSVDVVAYVETIEHVDAKPVGSEIVRVLRPGGLCYITTPPRLRHLLGPDPHYGIRGLLLLPDSLQRSLFRALRKSEPYEVTHMYWSVRGIMQTLPGLQVREIVSKNWGGVLRRLDWDWIVAQKPISL